MMDEDLMFKVGDPEGRTITLVKTTWMNHIIYRHPEMEGHYENIIETITQPNIIGQSAQYDLTLIYANNDVTASNLYVNVVVGFDDKYEMGLVRTSHLSASLLDIKKTIWIRKKY